MTVLVAHAHIALNDPEAIIGLLCAHLAEHGATETHRDGATLIALGRYLGSLRSGEGHLLVRAEAPDAVGLFEIKQALASHVVECVPRGDAAPLIVWTGDGAGLARPPNFRVLTVIGVSTVTPHMRRIAFRAEDLAMFDHLDALHVRLFLPPPELAQPEWPVLGADGLLHQPVGEHALTIRKYTIREVDAAAGTLSIDFVLHEDAGPGAAFAARARIGDSIGMAGPGGRGLREAGWYLFMSDETGLPAIARMLAHLPQQAVGVAIIEIADSGEEQALVAPSGIEIRWLHRKGVEAGTTTLLQDAFDAQELPAGDPGVYVWAALEHNAFKTIRAAARERLRGDRDSHLIVSYWRHGISEDQHAKEKAAARTA